MTWLLWIGFVFVVLWVLSKIRASLLLWSCGLAALLATATIASWLSAWLASLLWLLFLPTALVLNTPSLRRLLISDPTRKRIQKILPPMSDSEKIAIEAGSIWWDGELFSGHPNWQLLDDLPAPSLNAEEIAFLDGPVNTLCEMLDDWEITHTLNDLPPAVWAFLKQERFFGMIIPKQYGGLEFSAHAHSEVIMRIASRSGSAGVTVMVPNSLGPAELLLHYGTDTQKQHYLPRLANGEEIPCFALTNPLAGSDAGAIPDYGVICRGEHDGKDIIGIRLNWEKRYITLGPVATLLGLAFKVLDPDQLLSKTKEPGISCALIPTTTPGVEIGKRHAPLNAVFQNGPNRGTDVFIPLDWIIGGEKGIGHGWRMLMECLSAGRGISLPATAVSSAKLASQTTGAYARVRKQFKMPIGRFEGVEEALARIGGYTYMMDAARLLTTTALDLGEKPSVVTAIIKYQLTEHMRKTLNDAMDIHGGRGICMGPNNYLARPYQQIPIAITVEGANILTRSLIIFGQGAMRCHPYLTKELAAIGDPDPENASHAFDQAFTGHLGHTLGNASRSLLYRLSFGHLAPYPKKAGVMRRHYQHLGTLSAGFAFLSDIALLMLGGALKRKEKLSGRLADALGFLYLGSAILKHFSNNTQLPTEKPLADWACQYCLQQTEEAIDGVLRNFPQAWLGWTLRLIIMPWGRTFRAPSDKLGHRVGSLLLSPSSTRNVLTAGIFQSANADDITGRLEDALRKAIAAEHAEQKIRQSRRTQAIGQNYADWLKELAAASIIRSSEIPVLMDAYDAALAIIQVDDFPASQPSGEDQS